MTRTILTLIGASALAVLPVPVLAGTAAAQPTDLTSPHQQSMATASKSAKTSDLIGTEVHNYQDEKLGKVVDLAVDVESGRLVQVILSSGGFAGIGGTLYAVPPSALHYDTTKTVVRLDADAAKVKAAPEFEMSKWNDSFDAAHLAKASNHYGATKARENDTAKGIAGAPTSDKERSSAMPARRDGQFQKASKLVGMQVENLQGDKLGDVNNLLVNLSTGRVVAVVVSSGGFLGISDELSALPPSALRFSQDRESLQLDATKESLAGAPHFKSTQWPDFDQPGYAAALTQSFRGDSYARPVAPQEPDNTARNVRDRDDKSLTPLDQGNGKADVDLSARIRKEIMASDRLSTNGKNVKVITRDAHVTLRGPTDSAEEKRLIGEIAGRIAGAGNVDNQLEVKSTSAASL